MAITLTLSQITELSGSNPRRMKQLANEGVFIPVDGDRPSRAARLYSITESAVACIIAAMDKFSIPSPTLFGIASSLRDLYRTKEDHAFNSIEEAERFVNRETLLTLYSEYEDSAVKEKAARSLGFSEFPRGKAAGLDGKEVQRIRNYIALERARKGVQTQLSLTVRDDGSWLYFVDGQPSESDGVDVFIVFNLHRILGVLN